MESMKNVIKEWKKAEAECVFQTEPDLDEEEYAVVKQRVKRLGSTVCGLSIRLDGDGQICFFVPCEKEKCPIYQTWQQLWTLKQFPKVGKAYSKHETD